MVRLKNRRILAGNFPQRQLVKGLHLHHRLLFCLPVTLHLDLCVLLCLFFNMKQLPLIKDQLSHCNTFVYSCSF